LKTIRDFDLDKKTVILRCDLNVSIKNGKIIDNTRIVNSIPTINYLLEHNSKVVILSHLGKVKTVEDKKKNGLEIVYKELTKYLNNKIKFVPYTNNPIIKEEINNMEYGTCILLENTRFEDIDNKKESKQDEELSKYWASLGDIFINDAFGTIHRRHESNYGISKYLNSGIGFLVEKEIENLSKLDNPKRPFAVIMGGAKVSDKISIINGLIEKVDYLFIGGAMAFTFLKAADINVGKSLIEEDMVPICKELLTKYVNKIILPVDFYGSKKFSNLTKKEMYFITDTPDYFIGMDIGSQTLDMFKNELKDVETIFMNGPLGVYEFSKYRNGTKEIVKFLIDNKKEIYIGGGDIVGCVKNLNLEKGVTYISTGGGATLEFIANHNLPGLINIGEK